MGALWANCPFTRREEDLSSELSGHTANVPFLLMGNCTLEDNNLNEAGFNTVTAIVLDLHNGLDRKNLQASSPH